MMAGLVYVWAHVGCLAIEPLFAVGRGATMLLRCYFVGSHGVPLEAAGTYCYSTGCLSNPCLGQLEAGGLQLHPHS